MARFDLGSIPLDMRVNLPRYGDFVMTINASPGPWAAGVGIELHFYTPASPAVEVAVWPATVSGSSATWHRTAAQITAVRAAGAKTAALMYIDPATTTTLEWASGSVQDV